MMAGGDQRQIQNRLEKGGEGRAGGGIGFTTSVRKSAFSFLWPLDHPGSTPEEIPSGV